MAETAETKKIIDPRVEIDTSPPFESVKEAVDRFGGSGPWIPHHLLRLAAAHQNNEAFDVERIEEQAVQLERDLIMKEQQTLNVLKELESAKRFVEGLKLNLMPEADQLMSSFMESPDLKLEEEGLRLCPVVSSPALMFNELNQAKLNLSKTSVDLAAIQASVESLNKKLRRDKILVDRRSSKMQIQTSEEAAALCFQDHHRVSMPNTERHHDDHDHVSLTLCKELNFEAEQFKKMTEASRYEVMKAMAEIERTKNCIRMAEMRLNAAKKMEEAAKAVEAIAVAERKSLLNGDNSSSPDGITLSFQEYQALSQKAKQAEEMCKTKFIDTNGLQRAKQGHDHDQIEVPILEKFEETTNENKVSFNNTNLVIEDSFSRTQVQRSGSNNNNNLSKPNPGFRSTTSIGDVLSRKLILQDDVVVENHRERQHVSLSQMLREQSRLILHPNKNARGEGNVQKQYFMQRKKFGFIQVPIPTKHSKKKGQPLTT
ncbi:hypothetical protein C2S51_030347 [Perilla frutescens var. frutescens]|nr:hypothetical protein C2S51_030347 [Perilla frutescens var. frutescens]